MALTFKTFTCSSASTYAGGSFSSTIRELCLHLGPLPCLLDFTFVLPTLYSSRRVYTQLLLLWGPKQPIMTSPTPISRGQNKRKGQYNHKCSGCVSYPLQERYSLHHCSRTAPATWRKEGSLESDAYLIKKTRLFGG